MEPCLIRAREVSFAYPHGGFRLSLPALDLERSQTLAISGPSGSGKTTLIQILAGILTPHSGTVELSGLDLARLPQADRQDVRAVRLGLVFQEFELLEYLDVLDNILLPYRLTPVLQLDTAVRRRAAELAERLGLGDKLDRHPPQLSQGERQRVAVCRALVTRPGLVLCDEPTANLDPRNRDQVIDALLAYSADTAAPLAVVTHDPELLERFGQRLVLDGSGRALA